MQITINITLTVPDDGTTPIIKVNQETTKTTKKKVTSPPFPIPTLRPDPKPEKAVLHFNGTPAPNKMAERRCLYCRKPFMPRTHNHKFDTKLCKNKYRAVAQQQKPKSTPVIPRKESTTDRQKKMHGTDVTISKDPFYQQQLKKADKHHGKAYSRYVNEQDL